MYSLPYAINGWYKTQIGPWIRKERSKRFYAGYFIDQSDIPGYLIRRYFYKGSTYYNPDLSLSPDKTHARTIIFNSIPHSSKYFDQLKGHHQLVKTALMDIIVSSICKRISLSEPPEIGVHVRRGDFRMGNQMESMDFYLEVINFVRRNYGKNYRVVIFSDGYKHELKELLDLPNSMLYEGKSDIEDLIVLSKSKFIITSHGSTFSYWAVYLSDAIAFYNVDYEGSAIRWEELTKEKHFFIEAPPTQKDYNV